VKSDNSRSESVIISDLDIPLAIRQKLSSLGSSVAEINLELSRLEEAKKSQMALIKTIAADYDLPNVKLPDAFDLTLCQGKLTLKEQRLLEEGIPAATIESCKERGEPYWQVKRARKKD